MQKKEEREKKFFQYGKDLPSELKLQKEIECYDKVMELHISIEIYGIT